MAIVAKNTGSKDFDPAPAGLWQAVCCDVVDLGVLEVTYAGVTKRQHKVRVVWQIEEHMADGRPFIAQKRYTLSLHEKAALRHDLESWRGKPFTDDELAGFDLEKLIGVNCQVNIQRIDKQGTTYANIIGIVPIRRNMEKLSIMNYVRKQDRTDTQAPEEVPELTDDDPIPF